jgi:DNA-binding transcriptional LysR family regulator
MNIRAIRLFLHAVRRGSLGAAAGELNMSPSAASRLLSGLERAIGFSLFSRDRQRLHPTAEGLQYFEECYRALVAVDELPRAARRLASGARTRLKLVSVPRFATSVMIPAIARFMKQNPDIDIDFQIMLRHEIENSPSERSFDVGVAGLPLKNPALVTAPLLEVPAVAIMRRNHALAKRKYVRILDLAKQRLIVLPPGTRVRADVEDMFASEGVEFRPQITVTSGDVACQLVLRSDAVTIAEPLVPMALDAKSYALVPIQPIRMLYIGIVAPAFKPDSRLVTQFRMSLQEEAKVIRQRMAQRFVGKWR